MEDHSNSPEGSGDDLDLSRPDAFLPSTNNIGILSAVPSPGMAIFPQLLSDQHQTILMEGETWNHNYKLTNADTGQPILAVDAELFSLSHRKHIIEVSTGTKLCTIRHKAFSGCGLYYAETTDDGAHIFDAELATRYGPLNYRIAFDNACSEGEKCVLDFQTTSRRHLRDGTVFWDGRPVACVRRLAVFAKRYEIAIAPMLDPFVVLGLLLAVESKARARRG